MAACSTTRMCVTRHGMASCGTRGCARVHLGLGCNAAVDTSVPRNCPPSTRVHTLTASHTRYARIAPG